MSADIPNCSNSDFKMAFSAAVIGGIAGTTLTFTNNAKTQER